MDANPYAIYESLLAVKWPSEFTVEYTNGRRERLLKGEGVCFDWPGDAENGVGGWGASLPKKHPRNQKQIGRWISYLDLRVVYDSDGALLWSRPTAPPATHC